MTDLILLEEREILLPDLPDVGLDPLPESAKENLVRGHLNVAEVLIDVRLVHRAWNGRCGNGRTRRDEGARAGGEIKIDVGRSRVGRSGGKGRGRAL
jgi:hypothetical protein